MIEDIKKSQEEYRTCLSNFLDENLNNEKNFMSKLESTCKSKLSEVYTPYLERSTLNLRYFVRKFYERLDTAYLNLGRHGYNSHQCKNL